MATIFEKHQLKIAKNTLKMSDVMAKVMGGMTKTEAKEILKKYKKEGQDAILEPRRNNMESCQQ